ncbi:hypothetical protein ABZP36_020943 [Zizania latifolia]
MTKGAERGNGERAVEALESDGGSGVKRRRTDGEYGEGEPEVEDNKDDLISLLPDDMLREIVSRLPLRYGIRTQVVCKGWRNYWKERRRRAILHCTAAYAVENLHIDLSNMGPSSLSRSLRLPFRLLSRNLARLSVCATITTNLRFRGAQPFPELAAIYLHSVAVETTVFDGILALCPSLRVLDLRKCSRLDAIAITSNGPNLTSLTIADCDGVTRVDVVPVSSLRSIRYSGRFFPAFHLPIASCTNLYLSYYGLILPELFDKWLENTVRYLCDGTITNNNDFNITNLTICSNALRMISFCGDRQETARLHKFFNFRRLTELQLLMFEMKAENLASIYLFLKIFHCPNLSRLFVQFPIFGHEPFQENLLDGVTEVSLEDGLDNLTVVRIMNFNWHPIEVQLVSFLLRKARNIRTLQLVSPSAIPLNVAGIEQEDLSPIREALANGLIILSEFEDGATKPFHSEILL